MFQWYVKKIAKFLHVGISYKMSHKCIENVAAKYLIITVFFFFVV